MWSSRALFCLFRTKNTYRNGSWGLFSEYPGGIEFPLRQLHTDKLWRNKSASDNKSKLMYAPGPEHTTFFGFVGVDTWYSFGLAINRRLVRKRNVGESAVEECGIRNFSRFVVVFISFYQYIMCWLFCKKCTLVKWHWYLN